jgi:acyl-coenzyme A synthetase/AMP-(fatty) acid ligase
MSTPTFLHRLIIGNFAPLHFDQSLFGYFSGPLVGAKTIIFPDSYVKLPASLAKLVAKEKITLWFSVPLILVQILSMGQIDKYDFSSLRWVRFGGEVFPVKQLRELMHKWPHAKFINSYGPSEVARCTYYILEEPPKNNEPIPLGTVWGNTEYLIIDNYNNEVKNNEPGELLIRTATMMSGYWNNQELTEKSLFKLNVADGFNYIFYKTGDLVYENDKNELMFLGRIDRQIKLRGHRIELKEIEAVMLNNNEVEEAAAVVVVDTDQLKEIKVMVCLKTNSLLVSDDLLKFCKTKLPHYAVPSEIKILDNMPRNANGKKDLSKIKELLDSN